MRQPSPIFLQPHPPAIRVPHLLEDAEDGVPHPTPTPARTPSVQYRLRECVYSICVEDDVDLRGQVIRQLEELPSG